LADNKKTKLEKLSSAAVISTLTSLINEKKLKIGTLVKY